MTCTAQSNLVEERIGSSNGSVEEAPRSLYNTGASDLTKPGPLSLIDHEIAHEKTVVFVRHGMTTWNEQKRIQVKPACSHVQAVPVWHDPDTLHLATSSISWLR